MTKIDHQAITLLLALALALPAAADDTAPGPTRLGLAEAMARARERARGVAAAEARREASAARLRQARGHRLPEVRLEEIWIRTDSPAEAFALELNQERFSLADFAARDPNRPEAIESATTRLEVSLPLYTGGELASRIRQAELAAAAADETASWVADGAALAAAEAYITLALAREQAALLERSLETVQSHVALARAYVDQGLLVASERLRAEVEEARVRDLLAQARGQARVAEANLSFRLAADPSARWQLEPLPEPQALADHLQPWLASAESRPDLAAARQQLGIAELEERVQRAARLPKVGLVARRDLVDDVPFGRGGDSTAVMAVARLELWAGGRHGAARTAARAEAEAAALEVADFAAAVALEVREAFERARTSRDRQRTARAALDAARETERITEERFQQGVVKTLDLLDAATARREAETRELAARAEAHLASLELAVKAGRPPESAVPRAPQTGRDER